ncbi:MAG: tryptophan--tRNA ligase, partial [Planctomycetes bacterium]|nr:tryptophan--tRNA ligase [Planctomycetota bacterium]
QATYGFLGYPVLQAADILIYDSELVPVGADQKQHIEVTRDIAGRFNNTFGEIFTLPKEHILEFVAVVPGVDGRKMSKSYGNTIGIFESEKSVRKKIMRIVTDSTPVAEPKDAEKCNVFALLKLVAKEDELAEWKNKYEKGGTGYGDVKKRLAELIVEYFEPFREKRAELENNIDYVEKLLAKGAERAAAVANKKLAQVREVVGLRK